VRESEDALYLPNPKVTSQNPKKTPIEAEIRGFDPGKGSTKNHPPLRGLDIHKPRKTKWGWVHPRVEREWSQLKSIHVLYSPFELVCLEVGVIESLEI